MGIRINKVLGNVFGSAQVRRKDATETAITDRTDQDSPHQQQQQFQQQHEEPTDEELEKAITEMRASPSFTQTGMAAEIIKTKNGNTVCLKQGGGNVVRVMTASEFMRLKAGAEDKDSPRGKILDQKF